MFRRESGFHVGHLLRGEFGWSASAWGFACAPGWPPGQPSFPPHAGLIGGALIARLLWGRRVVTVRLFLLAEIPRSRCERARLRVWFAPSEQDVWII